MGNMHDTYWQTDKLNVVMRPFNHNLFVQHGSKVLFGPFAGMEIPEAGGWDEWCIFLKLFGEYERELHPIIERAVARRPDVIINVGCEQGYYAVGLARRLPEANVYAFDINADFLGFCRVYADKNGVASLRTKHGASFPHELDFNLGRHGLYFLDCEGAEFTLLNLAVLPRLQHADLIVELHDEKDSSKTKKLMQQFSATHDIELVAHEQRALMNLIVEWKFNNTFDGVALGDMRKDSGWMVAWSRKI